MRSKQHIKIYSENDFARLRAAGRLAAETLDFITPYVVPGVTTEELDRLCDEFIRRRGATSAPLGYNGFPKATCISLNHVVCHGIPDGRRLEDGDILNIDVTPILNGWYGDSSRMYIVGKAPVKAAKLIAATYESMWEGIRAVREGATVGDIGHAIQSYVEPLGFSVVRDFCGHGTGDEFHSPPQVMHYGKPGTGDVLKAGMVFTVEPMVNAGKWQTLTLSDRWTTVTRDRSLSAQFEHTLGVTKDGCEVFTRSPAGFEAPPYSMAATI